MTREPYVTADEVAAHLKMTRRQVLEMTRKGFLPASPLGLGQYRKTWRYKLDEVEFAIASGNGKPSASDDNKSLVKTPAARTMSVGSPRSQKGKL